MYNTPELTLLGAADSLVLATSFAEPPVDPKCDQNRLDETQDYVLIDESSW